MSRKIRIGIIGFGRIVELLHLPLIKRVEALEISGIFDITPERLALAEKRKLPVYCRLDELLADDTDVVLIATPPSSHYEHTKQVLEAGKHVVVEKPVGLNAQEAAELRQTSQLTGKSITVFMNRRYDPDYAAVKACIASGELGAIQFVERRQHMFGSGASFAVKSFDPNWRNKPQLGGGALLDWGVHLIDQLLELQLGDIQSVTGHVRTLPWKQGEVEDYVHGQFDLTTGIQLLMDINFASHAASPLWIVGGEEGTLVVSSMKEASLHRKGELPAPYPMPSASRYSGLPIYQGLAAHLTDGKPLEITIDQVLITMQLLDQLRTYHQRTKQVLL
jgi:scyllo-inositol 2-dehydrogenase (NADP+)